MTASKKNRGKRNDKKTAERTPLASVKKRVSSKKQSFRIVGIGASAGGLEAFEQFFSNMPPDSGMAFVIVQHLDPSRHSSMPDILTRYTRMQIREATDGMKVEPNSIYLIPPNKSMGIQEGTLFLQEPAQPPALRLPVDFFFRSLAKEKEADAICIILSGTGTDGTLGLRAIKAELGTVLVQEPESAKYDGMPRSAVDTGLADFVLAPNEMPQQLIQFVQHSTINGAKISTDVEEEKEPIQQIFTIMRTRTGHDFGRYKQTTIRRRLERRMSVNQIHDIAHYAHFLRDNELEARALLKDILISVTSFFRDAEAFEALKEKLKELVKKKVQDDILRIWVAGCATGEEAYSIAMIVSECLDKVEKHLLVQMYATDIDTDALSTARSGSYPANIAADVTPARLKRFFIKQNEQYRIRKELREIIVFAPQDFIKDPPFSRMDLICCRNLLIYLESDIQKKMLPLLHYALKPDGILFLGPSETIGEASDLFSMLDRKWKIYQRREVAVPPDRLKFPAAFAPTIREREAAGEPVQELAEARIPQITEKIFLDNYAPTFAVIDEKYRLVYVRGRTGKYLEIASGQPSLSILEMAREGLRTELASAIYRATSDKKKVAHEGVRVKYNSGFQTINLTVAPLSEHGMLTELLMVIFQDTGLPTTEAETRPARRSGKRVAELEEELKLSKGNLQKTIEELEATNEELKSANEELQSNNEELQSTNEELDTSREELQSLNEELTTMNAELQDKTVQFSKANDDLKNFLARTDIAIILLDEELKVRSFTPASVDVFNLRDIDVGRPLSEITSQLAYEGVVDNAREVLRMLGPKEIEVQRKDGHWYIMRILPYLTTTNEVNGVVMSFLDIDKQKQAVDELARTNEQLQESLMETKKVEDSAKEERDRLLALVNSITDEVWFADIQGNFTLENEAALKEFGIDTSNVVSVKEMANGLEVFRPDGSPRPAGDAPPLRALKGEIINNAEEIVRTPASGELRHRWVNASPVRGTDGNIIGSVSVVRDITERKRMEERIQELLKEREEQLVETQSNFRLLIQTMSEGVFVIDKGGRIQFANPSAARIFNMPESELIGYHFGIPANEGTNEIQTQVGKQTKILELNVTNIIWDDQPSYLTTLRDITLQKRALERVRMLSHRLVTAQEKERREIGRELHDEIGGALTGIKLSLTKSEKKLGEKAQSELKNVNDLLDGTMDLVSTLSHNMRPDILDEFGLVDALKVYLEQYTKQTGIKVSFKKEKLDERCPDMIETTAYRIIQESLTNVARYAGVKKATVSIRSDSEKLYIQVEDQGCGFDPQQLGVSSSGISGMQDRASVAGGELIVDSSPGKGTCVTCELPLSGT